MRLTDKHYSRQYQFTAFIEGNFGNEYPQYHSCNFYSLINFILPLPSVIRNNAGIAGRKIVMDYHLIDMTQSGAQ